MCSGVGARQRACWGGGTHCLGSRPARGIAGQMVRVEADQERPAPDGAAASGGLWAEPPQAFLAPRRPPW